MGLAIGAGFYECMLIGFLLILLSVGVFPLIENASLATARYMNIYVEFVSLDDIGAFIQCIKGESIKIFDIDLEKETDMNLKRPSAVFSLYLPNKRQHTEILAALSLQDNVCVIEEI
jgi:putative Mg2+ transporter-C (MgtC) family protein